VKVYSKLVYVVA